LGVTPIYGTSHHHAAQAHVERANRTIEEVIRTLVHESPTKWANYLQAAWFILNALVHKLTQEIPFFLVYGRFPLIPVEITTNPAMSTRTSDYLENLHAARTKAEFHSTMSQGHS
jgi:hypothetical protein